MPELISIDEILTVFPKQDLNASQWKELGRIVSNKTLEPEFPFFLHSPFQVVGESRF